MTFGLCLLFCCTGCGRDPEESKTANQTKISEEEQEPDAVGESSVEDKAPDEPAEEREKIGLFFPGSRSDDRWQGDAGSMELILEETGFSGQSFFADRDENLQNSQILDYLDENPAAILVAPCDGFALESAMEAAARLEIPVFSYDSLIMDTDAVKYFITFDTRAIGKQVGKQLVKRLSLDEWETASGSESKEGTVREETPEAEGTEAAIIPEGYCIEFFMGDRGSQSNLFFFNGLMERLNPYFETGALVCRSGVSFDDVSVMEGNADLAAERFDEICEDYYSDGGIPDIIVAGTDEIAVMIADRLSASGLIPGTEAWPMITGLGASPEGVAYAVAGEIDFTVLMDERELVKTASEVMTKYLSGEEIKGSDYEQYDNGVKLIRTMTRSGKVIDWENVQTLVENGYYEPEIILPDPETETLREDE